MKIRCQQQKEEELLPSPNKEKRYNLRPRKTITRANAADGEQIGRKTSKPNAVKMKEMIEKKGNKSLSLKIPRKHINSLAPEIVGRVFQSGLTIVDRLHCERVSPRWKWIVGAFGWVKQRKLDSAVVFEGATDKGKRNFTHANLISLLGRVAGPNLVELDFRSLEREHYYASDVQIAESLSRFPNLRTLKISGFNLHDYVDHLPPSLRGLQTCGPISVRTMHKLSVRCPNLERVPFCDIVGVTPETVNEFMGKFPRQKMLCFYFSQALPNGATFEAIAKQKELINLLMGFHADFDEGNERAFEAMAVGCESLRKIQSIGINRMSERALFNLEKMRSLTVLELRFFSGTFTDSVLKAIANRGQLKRLKVQSNELTDEGIVYLLGKCKSLVSLELNDCPRITDLSLKAVVAELHRRHGTPPRTFPSGHSDKNVFFFGILGTKSMGKKRTERRPKTPAWKFSTPVETIAYCISEICTTMTKKTKKQT